eukprot:scaffold32431_cov39-Prasinocladus_malaysianus.AAC.1
MDIDGSGLLSMAEVEMAMKRLELPCGGGVVKRVLPQAVSKLIDEMGVSNTHEVLGQHPSAAPSKLESSNKLLCCLCMSVHQQESAYYVVESIQHGRIESGAPSLGRPLTRPNMVIHVGIVVTNDVYVMAAGHILLMSDPWDDISRL